MLKKLFWITLATIITFFIIISLIGFAIIGTSIFIQEVAQLLSISRAAVLVILFAIGLLLSMIIFAITEDDSNNKR